MSRSISLPSGESHRNWNNSIPEYRHQKLKDLLSWMIDNKRSLAHHESRYSGKTLADAIAEVETCIGHWTFATELAKNYKHKIRVIDNEVYSADQIYEPFSRVLFILPYNFPLIVLCERLPYALAAGCAALIKCSEHGHGAVPLFCTAGKKILGDCLTYIDDSSIAAAEKAIYDESVELVSFTGSTKAGQAVMKTCANLLKPVNLELGGNNHIVVTASNAVSSIDAIIKGFTYHSGQCCISTTRLWVESAAYNLVKNSLKTAIEGKRFADPLLSPNTRQHSVYLANKFSKIYQSVVEGRLEGDSVERAFVYEQTIDETDLDDEEIFAPILVMRPYDDLESVIHKINRSQYGLAAVIWSKNEEEIEQFVSQVDCGRIWVNDVMTNFPELAIGGHKLSGIGSTAGIDALKQYSKTKALVTRK